MSEEKLTKDEITEDAEDLVEADVSTEKPVMSDEEVVHRNKAMLVICGMLTVFIALGFGLYSLFGMTSNDDLNKQKQQVEALTNDLDAAELAYTKKLVGLKYETTGFDADRVHDDTVKVTKIIKDLTTWKSGVTYNEARQKVIDAGVSEKSQLLTQFMPPLAPVPLGTDANGQIKTSNEVDIYKSQMAFKSLRSYVKEIKGDVYSYIVIADINGGRAKGKRISSSAFFTYTTDATGRITDIKGEIGAAL